MGDWASTERISADISLADQARLSGELHVQGRVAHHDGPETPLEMLNRSDPFFPVTLDQGNVAFLAKSQVAVVSCAPHLGQSDPERASAAKTIALEIVMAGGQEFRGWATLELPPTRARTLDYLNAAGAFFSLQGEDAMRLINRAHVRVVRPLD
jgi:hypothetical protein